MQRERGFDGQMLHSGCEAHLQPAAKKKEVGWFPVAFFGQNRIEHSLAFWPRAEGKLGKLGE